MSVFYQTGGQCSEWKVGSTQMYCKKCGWSLEPKAFCKPECPECGEPLYYRKVESK